MRPAPALRPTVYVPAGVPLSTLIQLAESASETSRSVSAPTIRATDCRVARTTGKRYPSAMTLPAASRFVATLSPVQA
jgi:hypothetical protein